MQKNIRESGDSVVSDNSRVTSAIDEKEELARSDNNLGSERISNGNQNIRNDTFTFFWG